VVGTLCAIAGKSRLALVRGLVQAYVEIIRNTPLLVQVFLVFFGLASIGWKLTAETAAVIALTVNVGAYTTEIMRAGINSIHPARSRRPNAWACRASMCTGMVLLPAVERVYPSLTSQFIL
jgi:polar amino acid transport system permease protein